MHPRIVERLQTLPDAPGVYLMKNADDEIIYIGKAQSLRDRVRSYFSGSDTRAFVTFLDQLLADIEVILTHTNKEAILLENELIKAHQPRFNVKLTDDKRYLCLRLDVRQKYPRLQIVRRFTHDGARYFGPYHSASSIRETLRIVNRHFQLRTCTDQVLKNRSKPCLQYQIKRCPAPCVFDLSDGPYSRNVRDVIAFLQGQTQELLRELEGRMYAHAERMEFEVAGALRDQIRAITRSMERQNIIHHDTVQRDALGIYREGPVIELHMLRTRQGRLMDARRYAFEDTEWPTTDILADFVARYYANHTDALPDEVLLPEDLEWSEALSQVLVDKDQKKVRIYAPKRGDKRRLVDLACQNAKQSFVDKKRQAGAAKTALEQLHRVLHLKKIPQHIECVDISHLQGTYIVASLVHFKAGAPDKSRYRRYKIRSTGQMQDDFKSIYEVISRRTRRGIQDNDLPDLFVIDGGKGQLAAARAALQDFGVAADAVDLISLAKSRRQATPMQDADTLSASATELPPPQAAPEGRTAERVFVEGQKNPVVLRQNSAELFLLVRARDEAHRFAITAHRRARRKGALASTLDHIANIGPKRRQKLLRAFGSLARLRQASQAQLAKVVGDKIAEQLFLALQKPPKPPSS